jgi:hypothetical protein
VSIIRTRQEKSYYAGKVLRQRTIAIVVVATAMIVIAFPLATIGGDATPAGASASPPLRARLLTTAEMPQGWMMTARPQQPHQTNSLPNCLDDGKKKATKHTDKVSVKFTVIDSSFPGIGPYPGVFENLETGETGIAAWNRGLQAIANCHTFAFKSQGQTIHGTIEPLPVPEVGDRSAAYAFGIEIHSLVHFQIDIVYFEIGQYLGDLGYWDTGTPNPTTLVGFANEAVDKIEGKPAHPPQTSVN